MIYTGKRLDKIFGVNRLLVYSARSPQKAWMNGALARETERLDEQVTEPWRYDWLLGLVPLVSAPILPHFAHYHQSTRNASVS